MKQFKVTVRSQIDGGVLAVQEYQDLKEATEAMGEMFDNPDYALCDIEMVEVM